MVRAGVAQWPRLFQNLRASFATDCVRELPANTAAMILGHSQQVAAGHYWTADASDLRQAVERLGKACAVEVCGCAVCAVVFPLFKRRSMKRGKGTRAAKATPRAALHMRRGTSRKSRESYYMATNGNRHKR